MKRSSSLAVIGFLTPHFSRSAVLHQRANAWPLSLARSLPKEWMLVVEMVDGPWSIMCGAVRWQEG